MAVEPAPDVALVQIVVDILATVILVLALSRLPRTERRKAPTANRMQPLALVAAIGSGALVTIISMTALMSRPRSSVVTPFYETNAKQLTGASDIVGAIIVDFRALDTLIEIAVFGLAGLGVYSLLRYAAMTHGDVGMSLDGASANGFNADKRSFGINGLPTSTYIQAMANVLLPVALVIATIHMLYGHDQPGDGFTAGVIASLAIGFKYVVFGFRVTRQRLGWLRPNRLIAVGALLAIGSGLAALGLEGSFLASADYGKLLGLPLPTGVKLSSGFIFEVAIALSVLGSVTYMLDTLGRPALDSEVLEAAETTASHADAAIRYPSGKEAVSTNVMSQ